jgi:O-antigen/teichoic acid export membrane protein
MPDTLRSASREMIKSKHATASFFRQSGWLMIANITGGILMWGVHFLAKAIPKTEYAVFGVFLAVAMCIPNLPLQMVLAQQTAKGLATGKEHELSGKIRLVLIGTFLLWALGALFVLIFQSAVVGRWQIANPAGLWVTLLVVLLSLWLPIFWGVLQGQQNFLWLGWSMMLNGIGRVFIAAFLVIVLGAYAAGMMIGVLLGMFIAIGIAGWQTRALWLIKPESFDWRALMAQVVPLMLGFGAFQFLLTADTMFTKAYFDGDTVAAYVGAGTMARALMWLVGPLATVMFPLLVHSAARSEKTDLMGLVLMGTALLAGLGALGLWLMGPLVVRIVYKANYVPIAAAVLPWYALAMVPLALGNVLLNSLLARGVYKVVPPLCVIAIGYALALLRFHDTLLTILKTLGAFNLLLFAVCAWFTWSARVKAELKSMGST